MIRHHAVKITITVISKRKKRKKKSYIIKISNIKEGV